MHVTCTPPGNYTKWTKFVLVLATSRDRETQRFIASKIIEGTYSNCMYVCMCAIKTYSGVCVLGVCMTMLRSTSHKARFGESFKILPILQE